MANAFQIEGYQTRFRRTILQIMEGVLVYVKKGINVKRRVDLETNAISCTSSYLVRNYIGKGRIICNRKFESSS